MAFSFPPPMRADSCSCGHTPHESSGVPEPRTPSVWVTAVVTAGAPPVIPVLQNNFADRVRETDEPAGTSLVGAPTLLVGATTLPVGHPTLLVGAATPLLPHST